MASSGMAWNDSIKHIHQTCDEDTMHCCDLMRLRWRGIEWNGDEQSIVEQMAHPHVRVVCAGSSRTRIRRLLPTRPPVLSSGLRRTFK
jgi:hypothetical protein